MKRPRGPGGRFLRKEELAAYYAKHPEADPSKQDQQANVNSINDNDNDDEDPTDCAPPAAPSESTKRLKKGIE
jgi:hypothetical protein